MNGSVEYYRFEVDGIQGIYPFQNISGDPRKQIFATLGGCSVASQGGCRQIAEEYLENLSHYGFFPSMNIMSIGMGLPRIVTQNTLNTQSIPHQGKIIEQIQHRAGIQFHPDDTFWSYSTCVDALQKAQKHPYPESLHLILVDPVGCYPYPGNLAAKFGLNPIYEAMAHLKYQLNPLRPATNNQTAFERLLKHLNLALHMRSAWITSAGMASTLDVVKELILGSDEHIRIAKLAGWNEEMIKRLQSTKPDVAYLSTDRPELREAIQGQVTIVIFEDGISSYKALTRKELAQAFPNAKVNPIYLPGGHVTAFTNIPMVIKELNRSGAFNHWN